MPNQIDKVTTEMSFDAQQLKLMRDGLEQQKSHFAGMADLLDEPFKSLFQTVTKDLDDALKALPMVESVPLSLSVGEQLKAMFSTLCSASTLISSLQAALQGAQSASASALNAEIKRRTEAGELFDRAQLEAAVQTEVRKLTEGPDSPYVPRALHAQLCAEAREDGRKAGEAAVRAEWDAAETHRKVLAQRRTECQTAGLPLPETNWEAILGGSDEEYQQRRATAEARIKTLADNGLKFSNQSLLAEVWKSEEEFARFLALAKEAKQATINPFAAAHTPSARPQRLLC